MYVPSYQMDNILNDYTKRLGQSRASGRQGKADGDKAPGERVNLSSEGKRQAVIEKVATKIVERITRFGPQDEIDREIVNKLNDEMEKGTVFEEQHEAGFVFNTIDERNNKNTETLNVDDSSFLVNRLEQLAREAVDQNMIHGRTTGKEE
jgi:hypothetical protein